MVRRSHLQEILKVPVFLLMPEKQKPSKPLPTQSTQRCEPRGAPLAWDRSLVLATVGCGMGGPMAAQDEPLCPIKTRRKAFLDAFLKKAKSERCLGETPSVVGFATRRSLEVPVINKVPPTVDRWFDSPLCRYAVTPKCTYWRNWTIDNGGDGEKVSKAGWQVSVQRGAVRTLRRATCSNCN